MLQDTPSNTTNESVTTELAAVKPTGKQGRRFISAETRTEARRLFEEDGQTLRSISNKLNVAYVTVTTWRKKEAWSCQLSDLPDAKTQCYRRYAYLLNLDNKTDAQFRELDVVFNHVMNLERLDKLGPAVHQTAEQRKRQEQKKKRGKPVKNDVSQCSAEKFEKFEKEHFFSISIG